MENIINTCIQNSMEILSCDLGSLPSFYFKLRYLSYMPAS